MSRVEAVSEDYAGEDVVVTADGRRVRVGGSAGRLDMGVVLGLFGGSKVLRVGDLLLRAVRAGLVPAPEAEERENKRSGREYMVLVHSQSARQQLLKTLNDLIAGGRVKRLYKGMYAVVEESEDG